jgi:DNA-binding beta-propeller fold protein YncE
MRRSIRFLAFFLFSVLFFSSPASAGDLLVSSEGNSQIIRYDETTGVHIGPGSFDVGGSLNAPTGMALDADGNLLVVSSASNNVEKFNGQTGASMGLVLSADFPVNPQAIVTFGTDFFVASTGSNEVIKYDSGGNKLFSITNNISSPVGLAISPGDQLNVLNQGGDLHFNGL